MNPTALAKVLSRLVESVPQEIPGTQFMYDEPKFNKGEYKHLAYLKTIKKTDSGRLDLVQDGVAGVGGTYALLDRNKQMVLYCMDYVVNKRGWVTQVKLWALDSDVYKAEKIERQQVHVFVFNELIRLFDAVVTDEQQTKEGKSF